MVYGSSMSLHRSGSDLSHPRASLVVECFRHGVSGSAEFSGGKSCSQRTKQDCRRDHKGPSNKIRSRRMEPLYTNYTFGLMFGDVGFCFTFWTLWGESVQIFCDRGADQTMHPDGWLIGFGAAVTWAKESSGTAELGTTPLQNAAMHGFHATHLQTSGALNRPVATELEQRKFWGLDGFRYNPRRRDVLTDSI